MTLPVNVPTRSSTGSLRRHCAVWSGQPAAAANVSPAASASASGCLRQRERAALHDRPLEEPARAARDHVHEYRQATGRLAGDRHVVRVAAEPADVPLDPAQRRLLVHQPVVARRAARSRRDRRVGEEAEHAEPVVDGDDDGAVRRELGAVVVAAGVLREAAAMDPHEHRAAAVVAAAQRRRGDVQVQAVLVERPGRHERARRLRAARRELGGVADAVPGDRRLRWPPAPVAGRSRRVGHPAERVAPGRCLTAHHTALDLHDRGLVRSLGGPCAERGNHQRDHDRAAASGQQLGMGERHDHVSLHTRE